MQRNARRQICAITDFIFFRRKNASRKSWLENSEINLKAKSLGKATRYINNLTCKFFCAKNKSVYYFKSNPTAVKNSVKIWSQSKVIAPHRKILWTPPKYLCNAWQILDKIYLLKIPILYFYFDSINAEIASIGIFYNLYFRALERIRKLKNFISTYLNYTQATSS